MQGIEHEAVVHYRKCSDNEAASVKSTLPEGKLFSKKMSGFLIFALLVSQ
jgi:hypothetical protein